MAGPASGFVGHVELHVGGAAGVLALTKDRFFNVRPSGGAQTILLVYDGAAYVYADSAVHYSGSVPLAALGPGNALYLQSPSTQVVALLSYWNDQTEACVGVASSETVAPATLAGDLGALFTPPFRLR